MDKSIHHIIKVFSQIIIFRKNNFLVESPYNRCYYTYMPGNIISELKKNFTGFNRIRRGFNYNGNY